MAITSFDPLYSATYLAILRGGGPCTSLYGRVYLRVIKGLFFFFFLKKNNNNKKFNRFAEDHSF
jgi:hypothetical protein